MKRIALIPARGGSKRIKDKNIMDFCGQPMIARSLQAARDSGLFEKIHVSTESERIRDAVELLGYPVDFMRSSELSGDHTPLMPVLRWVLERYRERGEIYDELCLIMPTAPLITGEDLKAGHQTFLSAGHKKAVLAVSTYSVPIEWAFKRDPNGVLVPCQPGMFAVRSQDLEKKYFDAGAFYFYPSDMILTDEPADDTTYVGHIISKDKVSDIDEEEDLVLAETLYLGRLARQTRQTRG